MTHLWLKCHRGKRGLLTRLPMLTPFTLASIATERDLSSPTIWPATPSPLDSTSRFWQYGSEAVHCSSGLPLLPALLTFCSGSTFIHKCGCCESGAGLAGGTKPSPRSASWTAAGSGVSASLCASCKPATARHPLIHRRLDPDRRASCKLKTKKGLTIIADLSWKITHVGSCNSEKWRGVICVFIHLVVHRDGASSTAGVCKKQIHKKYKNGDSKNKSADQTLMCNWASSGPSQTDVFASISRIKGGKVTELVERFHLFVIYTTHSSSIYLRKNTQWIQWQEKHVRYSFKEYIKLNKTFKMSLYPNAPIMSLQPVAWWLRTEERPKNDTSESFEGTPQRPTKSRTTNKMRP